MITYQSENVIVFQSGMFQLNSTVVVTKDLVLVVDPGYLSREVEEIRQYVNTIKGDRPVYLFFTHSDFDHIVGYGAFPEAKTIASKEFVESPLREAQLNDVIHYDDEFYIVRPYPVEYPDIDHIIQTDGEAITVGETTITFYHAFGHNNDGLMAVVESLDLLIAGDYLSDIEFPFVYYSFNEYKKTLNTLKSITDAKKTLTLITSHGSATNDQREILKRIDDSEEYLAIVENDLNIEVFEEFLNAKNYCFKTAFIRRHSDNIKVFKGV